MKDEILESSKAIRELLRDKLCPGCIADRETIALTVPGSEEDYRLGIFLYDIQDHSAIIPTFTMIGDNERQFPPKAVELSYMLFGNESKQFGGINRERMQTILNEAIRTLHDNPVINRIEGHSMQISFSYLDIDTKMKIWGSYHKPLQPAIYIKAVPVLIASGRVDAVSPVKDREYQVHKKPDTMADNRHL